MCNYILFENLEGLRKFYKETDLESVSSDGFLFSGRRSECLDDYIGVKFSLEDSIRFVNESEYSEDGPESPDDLIEG
jgi:hypothetical protein